MRPTVEIAPGPTGTGAGPVIALSAAPRCEPPYDDEHEPAVWGSARQMALDWSPSADRRRSSGPPAHPPAHRPVVAGASTDAKLAVRRFVHLCVEVLNGYRPPAHLRRLSLPAEAADVVAQGLSGARRVAELRSARRPGSRPPRRVPPVAVIRLRLCEPRPGAVEAAVALVTGERTWAMALRLELHHQCWSATALKVI